MIALGFDFDHTLGVDNGLERRAFELYAEEFGRPLDPDDPSWRACTEDLLARFRAGEMSLEAMVERFAAALGVGRVDPERWRTICYELVDPLVKPVDGARETLERLRGSGVPMAILTNGWTPLQQKKIVRALGDHTIERILVSDHLHALKPARAAFDALVAALGVVPRDVWYVGDSPAVDVAGALRAGLQGVWFDWEGLRYPQELPPPTLRIRELRELERLIENA
jgi:5'-nucleotidase